MISATLEGLPAVIKRLQNVDKRIKRKATKAAVRQGGKVVLAEAKNRVRKVSGLLRKSLGQKVKTFRSNGVSVSIVGPRVGYKIQIGTYKSGKYAGKPKYMNPTQYSHLVEKGTRHSRAFPFLEVALQSKKAAATQAMANVLSNHIEDAARGAS